MALHHLAPGLALLGQLLALLGRQHRAGIEHGLQVAFAGGITPGLQALAQRLCCGRVNLRRAHQAAHLLMQRALAQLLLTAGLMRPGQDLVHLGFLLGAGTHAVECTV